MNQQARPKRGVRRSGVGTGTTSLLMIFTVLVFATLAMLSLSTADSQRRIQERGLTSARGRAVSQGVTAEQVAQLDAALYSLGQGFKGTEANYYKEALAVAEGLGWDVDGETNVMVLHIPIDDNSEMVTELKLLAPGEKERYTVLRQASFIIGGWQPEGTGTLWTPPA